MKIKQRTCKYSIGTGYRLYDQLSDKIFDISVVGNEVKIDPNTDKAFQANYKVKQCFAGPKLR